MKKLSNVLALLISLVLLSGCSQENFPVEGITNNDSSPSTLEKSYNVSDINKDELKLAKIATARYNNFENAIADGYIDIDVVVPGMGHHFLKPEYLNAGFEIDKPELLVYSPHPVTKKMRLVAVEYAVPIALSPEPPSGFTGTEDQWGVYNNELWTLHAWVWEYNPNGPFAPLNPALLP